MPPFDSALSDAIGDGSLHPGFTYDEIGWIADLAPSIALRRGIDPVGLAGGVILTDAHRDAEPLWRLSRHRLLTAPARALLGGEVVVATTLLCLDVAFPAHIVVPGAVLATVHLDRRASPTAPGALHGRFGQVAVRRLSEDAAAEGPGRSFRVIYAAAADCARWPHARPAEPIGDADLWPAAHLAFG